MTYHSEHQNPYQIRFQIEKTRVGEQTPYDTVKLDGNLLLNGGRDLLNNLLTGTGSPVALGSANALVHVGDSAVTASAPQTELQGTGTYNDTVGTPHKWKKGMEPGFPQIITATGVIRYKARFLSDEANFTWQEFGVSNGATLFNRRVASPAIGTKTIEDEWVFSVEISFA